MAQKPETQLTSTEKIDNFLQNIQSSDVEQNNRGALNNVQTFFNGLSNPTQGNINVTTIQSLATDLHTLINDQEITTNRSDLVPFLTLLKAQTDQVQANLINNQTPPPTDVSEEAVIKFFDRVPPQDLSAKTTLNLAKIFDQLMEGHKNDVLKAIDGLSGPDTVSRAQLEADINDGLAQAFPGRNIKI